MSCLPTLASTSVISSGLAGSPSLLTNYDQPPSDNVYFILRMPQQQSIYVSTGATKEFKEPLPSSPNIPYVTIRPVNSITEAVSLYFQTLLLLKY
ncbi:hypothetical protein BCR33DRAFT_7251 [Rhizoclosmatium globosum]|uniref:Uncharacterized protein n=1 Tax=Rhizoclosmatium globosum TaxID=329046 RepID=A0A1Y2D3E9_9FUNG|nr:hypothetical protein BCR33DRAFT_7251 [Rhizoclosmatium globosum]|eukprot:ORY53737.1 hypothetical protein BCR33DRAFT_7251 [Rhizoclosmatium globosum]